MDQIRLDFGIRNDIEECKSFVERARNLAEAARERLDEEDVEYWTNSMQGWIRMIAELEEELANEEQGND